MRLRRVFLLIPVYGAAAIALLLFSLWLDHMRKTILPVPTGPFAVGRTEYFWTDPEHCDPRAPQPDTKRQLLAWVWFPAQAQNPTRSTADYVPPEWRRALSQQEGFVLSDLFTRDLSRVRAHSIENAEVASLQRTYPVILMRAGLAALTTDYTSLAEDLASHGYVVVGFDAPYRTYVVVMPDGRVVARTLENNADLVGGPEKVKLANKLVEAWSADMRFALDQVAQLNKLDPQGRFTGRLDMQAVGAFGHSLGGAEALQFCHDDPRCKAGIDVDGAPFGSVVAEGVSQPFMFLGSDHSREPSSETRPVETDIQSIFQRLPRDRRLMVTIRGAGHFGFSDPLKSPLILGVMTALGKRMDGRRQIAITTDFLHAFFDTYLKGAPATSLRCGGYQEVDCIR